MMHKEIKVRQISDRIAIREIRREDAEPLFEILDKERVSMRKWLPFVDTTNSYKDILIYINLVLPTENTQYVLLYEDVHVGLIGFNMSDAINGKIEIGYWLSPHHEGKGIVTQTVKELIKIAFFEKNLNRVQIRVAVDNDKSWRIPERLGFTFEGIERDGELLVDGFYTDIRVYSLLKKEYDNICK